MNWNQYISAPDKKTLMGGGGMGGSLDTLPSSSVLCPRSRIVLGDEGQFSRHNNPLFKIFLPKKGNLLVMVKILETPLDLIIIIIPYRI